MKKIIFILAALLTSFQATTLNANTVSTNNSQTVSIIMTRITATQVTSYLNANGYVVFSVWAIDGTNNWTAFTNKNGVNYQTTVYTDGFNIFGHEDMPD